jgi:hypothetical protein
LKALLWSLCVHLLLVGLLAFHHFVPPVTTKTAPPILAYAYQPVKAKAVLPAPVVKAPAPEAVVAKPAPAAAVKKVVQAPAKPVKKARSPVVQKKPQPKPVPKPVQVKPKPAVREFKPVRKPAQIKPLPQPKPAKVKPAVVAAKPVPKPAVIPPQPKPAIVKPVVVAAKPLPKPAVITRQPKPAVVTPVVVAAKPVPKPAVIPPQPKPAVVKPVVVAAKPVPQPAAAASQSTGSLVIQPRPSASSGLTGSASLASRAMHNAKQQAGSASAGSWQQKQKELALEITAAKEKKDLEMGRKVKTFEDGSSLIDTNPDCWKVPPPGSGKQAMWLKTSVPCKPDTTVEQINAILEKRRNYKKD